MYVNSLQWMKRAHLSHRKIEGIKLLDGGRQFTGIRDGHRKTRVGRPTGSNLYRHLRSSTCTNISSLSVRNSIGDLMKEKRREVLLQQPVFMEKLMDSVIHDNLPFYLVDSPTFRELLLYGRRDLALPSRKKLSGDIQEKYQDMFNRLQEMLTKATSRVLITFDLWTDIQARYTDSLLRIVLMLSRQHSPFIRGYIAVRGHFFDQHMKLRAPVLLVEHIPKEKEVSQDAWPSCFPVIHGTNL